MYMAFAGSNFEILFPTVLMHIMQFRTDWLSLERRHVLMFLSFEYSGSASALDVIRSGSGPQQPECSEYLSYLIQVPYAGRPLVLYHQNIGMVSNYRNLYNQNIGKYRNQITRSRCRFSLLFHSLHHFLFYLNKTLTDNILILKYMQVLN